MTIKSQTRARPQIEADRKYLPRDDYRLCQGDGCKNVIATWTTKRFCSKCRPGGRDERR